MTTEIDNNGRPTIEADLRDAQAEIRRLEQVNRELLAACKTVVGFYRQFTRLSCDEQKVCDAVSSAIEKAGGK